MPSPLATMNSNSMPGMLQYLLQDFQHCQYPVLALLREISLPYRKAIHSLEHSCAFRHQDDVEVTKSLEGFYTSVFRT